MKPGDIVRHCKTNYEGVIINVRGDYVEVLLTKRGMYKPEVYNFDELEVIKSEN